MKGVLAVIRRWFRHRRATSQIQWVDDPTECGGLVVWVALGVSLPKGGGHHLVLSDTLSPDAILRVVEYVRRRRLPVDGWVICDVHRLPCRAERAAAWLARLSRQAGSIPVYVLAARLPDRYRRRLRAHLARRGALDAQVDG